MKKIIYSLLILLLSSCAEFLKPQSPTLYIPENTEAIQELLIGSAYPTSSPSVGNKNINGLLAVLDPDATCSDFSPVSTGANVKRDQWCASIYSMSPDLPENAKTLGFEKRYNVWSECYAKLLGCNAALDYVDKVSGPEEEKMYIKAQAHGLRAFYYFLIVNMYAPTYGKSPDALGAVLKLDSKIEYNKLSRSTVKQTYNQIIKDLTIAEEYFKKLPPVRQFRKDYMVNLPMIQLLLSRTYLYMEKWSEAAQYAELVIKNRNFRLFDLNTISAPPTTPTIEDPSIFPYYNFNSYDNSAENIWLWGDLETYAVELNYTLGTAQTGEQFKRHKFCASEELLSKYVEGDLRKTRYIITERWTANNQTPFLYTAMAKIPVDHLKSPQKTMGYASTLRLSEAYLNRAEALTMLHINGGDASEVYELIDRLRQNRFDPEKHTNMPRLTGEELLKYVRNERRLELCFESGHRFYDVRRWGERFQRRYIDGLNTNEVITFEPFDPCLTLPLPLEAWEENPNIKINPKGEYKLNISI